MILILDNTKQLPKAVMEYFHSTGKDEHYAIFASTPPKANASIDRKAEPLEVKFDDPPRRRSAYVRSAGYLFSSTNSHNRGSHHIAVVDTAESTRADHTVDNDHAIHCISSSAALTLLKGLSETEVRMRGVDMEWTFLLGSFYADDTLQVIEPHPLSDCDRLLRVRESTTYDLRWELSSVAANRHLPRRHARKSYAITGREVGSCTDIAAP